ncbi:MAG: LamG domain-containing protein, partial [Proteobacteria bacterium]|nr:LamG domain-containing protein [Pseudomonadota bacterium]
NGNANDESGNLNHGAGINVVLTSDRFGIENKAYDFNGAYISIPSSTSLESPTTELSMVALVYREPSTTLSPIMMKSESTTNAFQYRMHVYDNGIGSSINDWSNGVGSEVPISINKWHLIVVTLKDGVVKGYLDGNHIDTDNLTGATTIALDTHNLEIGRDVPGAIEYFNGKIDDVRIYNREIKAQEVMALFDEGNYQQLFKDGFEN